MPLTDINILLGQIIKQLFNQDKRNAHYGGWNKRTNDQTRPAYWCQSHLRWAFSFIAILNVMTDTKNQNKAISLTVTEGLTVTILPDSNHEFLMDMKQAATGYGTSEYAVRQTKIRNQSELIEGKHYISAVTIRHSEPNAPHNKVFWTKRGIVRLGFFIKSERAKLFRDWAEELVIEKLEPRQQTLFDVPGKQLPAKRNHNRLTSDRLLSIMADVTRIDDRELRLSIANKLMMGGIN